MAGAADEASGVRTDGFSGADSRAGNRAFQHCLLLRQRVGSQSPADAHVYADDDVGGVRDRGRALPDAFDVGRGPAPKEFSQRGYEPVPAATTSTLVAAHPAAFGALWCSSRRRRSDTADNRSLLLRLSEL